MRTWMTKASVAPHVHDSEINMKQKLPRLNPINRISSNGTTTIRNNSRCSGDLWGEAGLCIRGQCGKARRCQVYFGVEWVSGLLQAMRKIHTPHNPKKFMSCILRLKDSAVIILNILSPQCHTFVLWNKYCDSFSFNIYIYLHR